MAGQCCCQMGAAVRGERPEFECYACPKHGFEDSLAASTELCKRHKSEYKGEVTSALLCDAETGRPEETVYLDAEGEFIEETCGEALWARMGHLTCHLPKGHDRATGTMQTNPLMVTHEVIVDNGVYGWKTPAVYADTRRIDGVVGPETSLKMVELSQEWRW